jgi:hypothetical protein
MFRRYEIEQGTPAGLPAGLPLPFGAFDEAELASVLQAGDEVTLQTSSPLLPRSRLEEIGALCARHGPQLAIRFQAI